VVNRAIVYINFCIALSALSALSTLKVQIVQIVQSDFFNKNFCFRIILGHFGLTITFYER